ncbi:MAG: hypothetical protein HFJ86_03235 [Oscillospiraceae bacterium]|nr:hypothetical protein [Oscillospiraceae bacterium]
MAEICLNSVFDAVSLALHRAFPQAQVHGEEVKQGLRPGDFIVQMPAGGQAKTLGERYRRTPTVDVVYFPRRGSAECYRMAEQLALLLESVVTPEGDTLQAGECSWAYTDGALHVQTAYEHFAYLPQEEVPMETLHIDQRG